jgi:RimJ/RimL family protein N-acetyltransferase
MERQLHQTAAAFLEVVGPALEEREKENNLVLGIALAQLEAELAGLAHDPIYLAHLGPATRPCAALLMTAPYPLLIAPFTEDHSAIARAAVAAAVDSGLRITGVNSISEVADHFADTWKREADDVSTEHIIRERLYAVRSVADIPTRSGVLEPARPEHFPVLVDWFRAFHNESMPTAPELDYAQIVGTRIEHGTMFVWLEGNEPLGMAGSARQTRKAICVNAVYTPPEHRGKGVATSCVATLTKLLLKDFASCVLFADLANDTSNAIYQRIGYAGIQDFTLIHFG